MERDNLNKAFIWVLKIINSINSQEQLLSGRKLISNFYKQFVSFKLCKINKQDLIEIILLKQILELKLANKSKKILK